jgi:DNA-binding transcriptional regulator YiaG
MAVAYGPTAGARYVDDLWLDPFQSTTAGPGVSYQVLEFLGEYARGVFGSVDPDWRFRYDAAVEIALAPLQTASGIAVRERAPASTQTRPGGSAPERVARIRASLGLNVSETARVLGVQRPTIYAWLADQSRPQRSHWLRLIAIEEVAAAWLRLSALPLGEEVRRPTIDGRSLVDLLTDDPLPVRLIHAHLAAIAPGTRGAAPTTTRVQSVRDSAKRVGLEAPANAGQRRQMDWITKRPFASEDD